MWQQALLSQYQTRKSQQNQLKQRDTVAGPTEPLPIPETRQNPWPKQCQANKTNVKLENPSKITWQAHTRAVIQTWQDSDTHKHTQTCTWPRKASESKREESEGWESVQVILTLYSAAYIIIAWGRASGATAAHHHWCSCSLPPL